jgi:hypothetical protein
MHADLQVGGLNAATGAIVKPNFWQQLDVAGNIPTVQDPVTPHWGKVTGFAVTTPASVGWTTTETNRILEDGNFPVYTTGNTSDYKAIVS